MRAWIAMLAGPLWLACAAEPGPPNVLLYVVDTLRADSLGCYGNPVVETPGVDRLAREGTLFEDVWAQSSWTRTSVASLLTSLYPAAHGARERFDVLSPGALLLSEILQGAGYRTGFVTSNPNLGSAFGFDQGFGDFVELYGRREPGFVKVAELATRADEVTRRAAAWIDASDEPFFLAVVTIDPHSPYTPPARFDRYADGSKSAATGSGEWLRRRDLGPEDRDRIRSLYDAEVAANDEAFADLIDHLRRMGRLDRTIVVFTSDHGEEFWEHGERGHGLALYEESIRVPLVLRYPPAVAAGMRVARPVQSVDVAPTILELVGLPAPAVLDGRTLFAPREADAFASLRLRGHNHLALREGPWKLIWDLTSDKQQLFDLSRSPDERHDVASEQPERTRELAARAADRVVQGERSFRALSGGGTAPRISPEELSEEERTLLDALGYGDDGRP